MRHISVGFSILSCIIIISCSNNNSKPLFSVQERDGGKWSIIDENGQFFLEDEFSGEVTAPVNGMFYSEKPDGTFLMYSLKKPDVPIGPVLKDWSYFSDDVALVVEPEHAIEIINKVGDVIAELPSKYVFALEFENGYSIISDRLFHDGLLDKKGNVLVPTEYDDIILCSNNTAVAKRNNHYGLIDLNTYKYTQFSDKYDKYDMREFSKTGTSAIFCDDDKFGIISLNDGEILIRAKYDRLSYLQCGLIQFKQDGLEGIMDASGNVIVKNRYEEIHDCDGKTFIGDRDGEGLYGLFSMEEEKLVKPIYEDLNYLRGAEKRLIGYKEDDTKVSLLDYSGEVLGRYYEIQNLEKVETVANSHVKSEFYSVEDILEPLWGRRDEDGNLTVKQLFGFEGLQPSQLPWGDKQVSVDDIFRQYAISWGKKYIYSCMRDIGTRNIETVALFDEPISIRDSYKYYWNNDARCDELLYTIELDSFDESHMESLTEEKVAGYFKSLGFNVDSNKYTLDDLIIEYELRNNTMFFDMYKKSSSKHIEFADLIYEYM